MPLEVHVVTPEREVWSGQAEMLIARGVDGEVGILGGHAPMMVQLAVGPLRIQLAGGSDEVRAVVDGGFLHVTSEGGSSRADVLANGAALADEIDVEAARMRLEELGRASDTEDDAVKAEIAKAEARVALRA